ncbi:carboxymuconolactone decarboxylase family protein [Streptomyces morookaense]|uniref:Carboxymuconolactone decarboxylase family protein n=1 Tax=Streptomyces morookaense TaxID=1970 RepID=A0A7Y7E8Z6_STRMO|nr:carboxymuconolactone decarboxylase family protein [Streptomyces morookaense]NVK80538.1 carboxymuconolactone decarboxylase family protein [Streptomyces morookaense]GHF47088.1 4-carboxymuconolactone decarboxylase [Streptomyces morookaense]
MHPSERHAEGDKIRREVLGDEYVNTMLRDWDPAKPLLELVTEYSWGFTWSREGLDRRTRSLLLVALLTGLNRPAELKLHIGGALRNGCTPEELAEVALQCAVYAGAPAGIDTMKLIRQEVARFEEENEACAEGN